MDTSAVTLQAVQEAIALLHSVGVAGLCLSSPSASLLLEDKLLEILPFCNISSVDDELLLQQQKQHTTITPAIQHQQQQRWLETSTDDSDDGDDDGTIRQFDSWEEEERFYLYNFLAVLFLLVFVAIMAGLYLGLLTLDVMDLQILDRTSKDEDERRYARELLPIVRKRHQLLVTILLVDTLAYEALPIFLETLVPSWVAVLLSCTLILVFGEVIPSGIFTGPQQLYLAYTLSPMVKCFMWLLYPIATPIARLLDILTHNHKHDNGSAEAYYNREEMSALVRIQHEERMMNLAGTAAAAAASRRPTIKEVIKYQRNKDRQWNALKSEIMDRVNERYDDNYSSADNNHHNNDIDSQSAHSRAAMDQLVPPLHPTEVTMIEGALSLKTKLAMDVYTPFSHVYSLPHDLILNKASVTDIFSEGYSRVPVYRRVPNDPEETALLVGFLMTRQLMMIDWKDCRELCTLYLQRPKCVSPRMNLVDVLKVLQTNGPQMTFVCARPDLANKALQAEEPIPIESGLMGIVTLVDIMESILQDRIYDEEDIRDRDRAVATLTRWAATKLQSFMLKTAKVIKQKSKRTLIVEGFPPPVVDSPERTTNGQQQQQQQPEHVSMVVNEATPLLSENNLDMV